MPTSIQDAIRAEAIKQGIPPAIALAVAEQESSFNPLAQGPEITVGGKKIRAQGLFQLLPDTAASLKVDHADPAQNIAGGVRYLRTLLDQHKDDPDPLSKALTTYGGVVHDTQYVPSLLARIERYKTLDAANSTAAASQAARQGGAGPAGAPKVGNLTNPTGRASGAGPGPPASSISTNPAAPGEGFVSGMVKSLDPRGPEGRRNLAGMAGEVGLNLLAAVPVAGPGASLATRALTNTARVVVPAIGAAAGGAAEQVVEQAVGTPMEGSSPGEAAIMQGAYSMGGQAMLWPLRLAGRAALGTRIGQAAKEALDAGVITARAARAGIVADARAAGRAGVAAANDFAAAALRDLRGRTAASLADVELENGVAVEGARSLMNQLVPAPGSMATVGAMREVFEGPTKIALDKAGEQVAATAVSGPVLNLAPLQASLSKMVSKARPSSLFPGAVETGSMAQPAMAVAGSSPEKRAAAGIMAQPQTITAEEFKRMITQQNALPAAERMPLTGILETIQGFVGNLGDAKIAFADAHALKRLLDERVSWDRPAKAINEQLTKGIRGQLREMLAVHEPYNVATEAYAQLAKLYRRGVGKKLSSAFRNDPDAAARILDPKSPSSAVALRSLLVEQAAAGGDAAGGQAAWDGARSMFTHTKLLKGGVDGLGDRIAKMRAQSPEFFKTVYGDPAGQEIISNLTKISAAVAEAQSQGAYRTALVTEAGDDALQMARAAGTQGVLDAQRAADVGTRAAVDKANAGVRASVETRKQFQKSSLVPPKTGVQALGDVAHVAAGGLRTGWAVRSLIRLLQAPSSADLLQWASYDPGRAQQMVKILTSPIPDRVAAGFLRAAVTALGDTGSAKTPAEPAAAAR